MGYIKINSITCLMMLLVLCNCEKSSDVTGTPCIDYQGRPKMCYPPYQNHVSADLRVTATNTCGMTRRQKYCVTLSNPTMSDRCNYCDNSNPSERHDASYITDHNTSNWWQSETLASNKIIHYEQSVNITVNLGQQFHVTFMHIRFMSPRPGAMVIYRKYNDSYPWAPWIYLSRNCKTYFDMHYSKDYVIKRYDEVVCDETYSSLDKFYDGVITFSTLKNRPGSEDFFNNKDLMDWITASQLRFELRKMNAIGDEHAGEETLMTHYFAISSLQVAGRCLCNGHGNECRKSNDEGVEPKLFCVCHSSHHTTGRTCERCETFYQDVPWKMATPTNPHVCKICDCNGNSESCVFNEELYIKSGNVSGGLCLNCQSNTRGPHCEDCLEGFYKDVNNPTRCIPCNCDPIGRASVQCDHNGKCTCNPRVDGEKCTRCKGDSYNFGPTGCQPCNCYASGVNETATFKCNPSNGICYCKKNVIGEKCDSCVQGYFSLSAEDPLGCRPCFCFAHTKDCTNASGFAITEIVSDFTNNDWKYGVGSEPALYAPLAVQGALTWSPNEGPWQNNYFLFAPAKFIGNHRLSYNLHLELTLSFGVKPGTDNTDSKLFSTINDVELVSDTMSVSVPFYTEGNPFPEAGSEARVFRYRLNEESGMWRDRMDHFRFISILSNLTAIKIRLTNHLGFTRLHKAVLFSAVGKESSKEVSPNLPLTTNVEKCSCPPQYTGLSCQSCSEGFHRLYPVGTEFVKCVKCMCNNQSDVCDVRTGQCHCKYNTMGHNCENCKVGYYRDPTTSIANVCKPCNCPGGTACELVKMADGDRVVCTDCPDNLGGYRCNRCRDNFFGNPKQNIPCRPCNCHGNIDYLNSCDSVSGKCSNCLYNSAGDYCETCKPGFHLTSNEYAPYRCERCICSHIGTSDSGLSCDVNTGQCHCLPDVAGRHCDVCRDGFFNLSPIQACEPCKCFIPASHNNSCDLKTGQCFCKPGVEGINCDRCEPGYFNLSTSGCKKCQCDFYGSLSQNCHAISGVCTCKPNVVGSKCDMCIENHHNITGGCPKCSPCYDHIQRKFKVIYSELNAIKHNVNSLNGSESGLRNISIIILYAEELNTTVHNLLGLILKDYSQIEKLNDKMDNSDVSIDILIEDVLKLKGSKKDEELQKIIDEIKTLKRSIDNLIHVEFKIYLEKLKTYVNDKTMTDRNITKTAELAQGFLKEVFAIRDKILNEISKAERALNDSMVHFLELLESYNKFKKESEKLDTFEIGNLSKDIAVNGLSNLNDISKLDKRYSKLEDAYNDSSKKMEDLKMNLDELLKDLDNIKNNVTRVEVKLVEFMNPKYILTVMEANIIKKRNTSLSMAKNMTELRELKGKLDAALKNINDVIAKSKESLMKLQDFDEVVKSSKVDAYTNLEKLPKLKQNLKDIELEIERLRGNLTDIIQKINAAFNVSKDILFQSKDLEERFKMLLAKTNSLKTKSKEDLDVSMTVKSKIDNQTNAYNNVQTMIDSVKENLKGVHFDQEKQRGKANLVENLLVNIEKQLKQIEDSSKTMNDDTIEQYSKMITLLTSDLSDLEQNQFMKFTEEVNLMDEELATVKKEIDESDVEIERLKQINSYMIGSAGCHRSGGTVER